MALAGGQGTTFGEEYLEKEIHMEKEKKCGIIKKSKNKDNIIFLLLSDIRQKIYEI